MPLTLPCRTEVRSTPGVSLAVRWPILQLELLTTLLLKSSTGKVTPIFVIGGLLVRSCLNVLLAGRHSVPKTQMTPTARLLTGGIACTSPMSWFFRAIPRV